jgi:hypothetical protein
MIHLKNLVKVSFDDNIESVNGIHVSQARESQEHFSVKGVVEQVPKLIYKEHDFEKPYSQQELKDVRELYAMSTTYNCDMELSVGDRVLFSYMAHFDYEGYVDYDMIVAKLDPIRPINGWLLFEMQEKPVFEKVIGDIVVYNKDVNDYGLGVVKYAAKPLKGYIDYPEVDDDKRIKKGSTIYFNRTSAVRMELDVHNSLTKKQSSLFRIHRKNVLMFKN